MRSTTNWLRGTTALSRLSPELSPRARQRLRWIEHMEKQGNKSLTCRYFGISRPTLDRALRRYDPRHLASLEDVPSRPRRRRTPTWTGELATAVRVQREAYPRWGKEKIACLLRAEGWTVSTSMVGRILTDLTRRGVLRLPLRLSLSRRKRATPRPYATRKPKTWRVLTPGDLIQFDSQKQSPEPGVTIHHFGARDTVSRWDVVGVYSRATARNGRDFLRQVLERMPFPVRAVQIDGGSEFKAEFEEACAALALPLFILPPKSPKLNGRVERSHRTHEEEFYQCYDGDLKLSALRPALRAWEDVYNRVRPHQALGYRTPSAWLELNQKQKTDQSRSPVRPPFSKGDSTTDDQTHV
ncbi:MAG: integrase core domain-containing protein [Gemmatimonadaceae bacterium]